MTDCILNISADGMASSTIDLLSSVAETVHFLVAILKEIIKSTTLLNVLCQLLLDVQHQGTL
jgi:hypothetical protein